MKTLVAQNIKALRERYLLNQTDMAKLIGVKQNSVAQWEAGLNLPNIDNLYKISRVFEEPMEHIMTEENGFPLSIRIMEKIQGLKKELDERKVIEYYRALSLSKKREVKKLIRKMSKAA